jgi:glycosyltransferase involved in cell wall biosynthesis
VNAFSEIKRVRTCVGLLLSVVVPCKDEQEVIRNTHVRLSAFLQTLPARFEIIYVDDGSTDHTADHLRDIQAHDPTVRVVRLSRNFGHQIAITAGMEEAAGDLVAVIDADLQDPPELIADFLTMWERGNDVVYGVRAEREGETKFKLWTAKLFYRLIQKLSSISIPLDAGDFRLMDRKAVDAVLAMPERDRFLRGMFTWVGFRQCAVPYRRVARYAGQTKYPFYKMLYFAVDGIVSFSAVPLRVATLMGFVASALAMLLSIYAFLNRLLTANWVTGWTTLVIGVLFMGGVQLICFGILGEYVGRIYAESKRRPLYIVEERLGMNPEQNQQVSLQARIVSATAGSTALRRH